MCIYIPVSKDSERNNEQTYYLAVTLILTWHQPKVTKLVIFCKLFGYTSVFFSATCTKGSNFEISLFASVDNADNNTELNDLRKSICLRKSEVYVPQEKTSF